MICDRAPTDTVFGDGASIGAVRGYGSNSNNDNRLRIGESIEWMVCHSGRQYLHHRLLVPAIINFPSQSDGDSYHHFHQKNLAVLFWQIYQYIYEIVFATSIILYHHCCAAPSFIATPLLYCNLCCVDEILSLVCVSVKR